MSRILLDDELRAKLKGLSETVELCDAAGRVVGVVLPCDNSTREIYDWLKAEVSNEELDRASREPGGMSLAEIKQRWGWE